MRDTPRPPVEVSRNIVMDIVMNTVMEIVMGDK
jgi:hypothetical protein